MIGQARAQLEVDARRLGDVDGRAAVQDLATVARRLRDVGRAGQRVVDARRTARRRVIGDREPGVARDLHDRAEVHDVAVGEDAVGRLVHLDVVGLGGGRVLDAARRAAAAVARDAAGAVAVLERGVPREPQAEQGVVGRDREPDEDPARHLEARRTRQLDLALVAAERVVAQLGVILCEHLRGGRAQLDADRDPVARVADVREVRARRHNQIAHRSAGRQRAGRDVELPAVDGELVDRRRAAEVQLVGGAEAERGRIEHDRRRGRDGRAGEHRTPRGRVVDRRRDGDAARRADRRERDTNRNHRAQRITTISCRHARAPPAARRRDRRRVRQGHGREPRQVDAHREGTREAQESVRRRVDRPRSGGPRGRQQGQEADGGGRPAAVRRDVARPAPGRRRQARPAPVGDGQGRPRGAPAGPAADRREGHAVHRPQVGRAGGSEDHRWLPRRLVRREVVRGAREGRGSPRRGGRAHRRRARRQEADRGRQLADRGARPGEGEVPDRRRAAARGWQASGATPTR